MASPRDLDDLKAGIGVFATERDWGQFHTPRDLVLALTGEVGELAQTLRWIPDDQTASALASEPLRGRFQDEFADVMIYLLRLADVVGIDVAAAVEAKIAINAERYPIATSKGRAEKYVER